MSYFIDASTVLQEEMTLPPLSEELLSEWRPVIYQEVSEVRRELRQRCPEGLQEADISQEWLMECLQRLREPTRRYLAHHWSWL